jgi:hypothetical protein
MAANVDLSGLQFIRLDQDSLRYLPEQIRQAAEVIAAFVAGLDQGQREAEVGKSPEQRKLDEERRLKLMKKVEPDDVHDAVAAEAVAAPRAELTGHAEQNLVTDRVSAATSAAWAETNICVPISGIRIVGGPVGGAGPAAEIVVAWGTGLHQKLRELLT